MPSKTVHAPILTFDFDCRFAELPKNRMTHFVRRHAMAMHLVTAGSIRALMSTGHRYTYPLNRLTLTWGAIPHLAEYAEQRNALWTAIFPIGLLLRWELPKPFVAAVLRGKPIEEPNPAEAPHDVARMAKWSDDLRRGDPASRQIMVMELQARTRRLARDAALRKRPSRRSDNAVPASDRVERMLQLIANSGADARQSVLRVSDVADAVGLHADTASRFFARSVGIGLGAFLTQHRMALAQSMLASTDAKIADIADSAGFGSVSQFHAVFRRHTGLTPDRYRKAALRSGDR